MMLLPGTVIYADRKMYFHYGVYVGNGMVVNYKGAPGHETDAKTAMIRLTSIEDFAGKSTVYIDKTYNSPFSGDEIARRARNKVGTGLGEYNLMTNNCEHFANWCRYNKKTSSQVDNAYRRIGNFFEAIIEPDPTRKFELYAKCFGKRKRGELASY